MPTPQGHPQSLPQEVVGELFTAKGPKLGVARSSRRLAGSQQSMNQHIYLKRNGETSGPFSVAQVQSMWSVGNVTADSEWKEGFDGMWQPFSALEAKIAPAVAATPTAPVTPASAPAAQLPEKAKKRRVENPVGGGCALQGLAVICFMAAIGTFMTGVGPVIFGIAGIWLFFYGRSKAVWWECDRCGSKLESEDARVCGRCGGKFV